MKRNSEGIIVGLYLMLLEELGGPGVETLRLHDAGDVVLTRGDAKAMVQKELTSMQARAYQLYLLGRKHEAMGLVDKFSNAMKATHERIDRVIASMPCD